MCHSACGKTSEKLSGVGSLPSVGSRERTQIIRLGDKCLYTLNYLTSQCDLSNAVNNILGVFFICHDGGNTRISKSDDYVHSGRVYCYRYCSRGSRCVGE